MPRQAMSYRTRVAAQVHVGYPLFPSVIMDLILKLAMGKFSYDVSSHGPVQTADFDFLYTKRKLASSIFYGTRVFGTACGEEFPVVEQVGFSHFHSGLFKVSKPSLVGKNGRAVLDTKIRSSREVLADQIKLDREAHSTIVFEIERLVQVLGHTNKVTVKLHKLLLHFDMDSTQEYIDKWPKRLAKETGIYTAFVPFAGSGGMTMGGGNLSDTDSQVVVFDPREMAIGVRRFMSTYHILVFQVFDTGVPDPDARVIGPLEAFSKAIARGFNKVAIQAVEDYGERHRLPKARELQGADKVFADHARASGAKKIEVCEVFRDKEGQIFRPQVVSTVNSSTSFLVPRCHRDDSEDDEEEQEQAQEQEHNNNSSSNSREEEEGTKRISLKRPRTHSDDEEEKKGDEKAELDDPLLLKRVKLVDEFDVYPRFDEFNRRDAVKDEYRLGDTLFLATSPPNRRFDCFDIYDVVLDPHTNTKCSWAIIAHF